MYDGLTVRQRKSTTASIYVRVYGSLIVLVLARRTEDCASFETPTVTVSLKSASLFPAIRQPGSHFTVISTLRRAHVYGLLMSMVYL